MTSQIKHTPKQIFELMLTQQLWAFDDEDFERMWLVFVNTFSEILQQKPLPTDETVEDYLYEGIDKKFRLKLQEVFKLGVIAGIHRERKRLLEMLE